MNLQAAFDSVKGWNTKFVIDGKGYGGTLDLSNDPRLAWHIETLGGIEGKRILELGPMEAAHTKQMIEAGAKEVIGIEGDANNFYKCGIVKDVFKLDKATFILADFCKFVEEYNGKKWDIVSAAGVLYHQTNPVKLIYNLAEITDNVIVWSQVAGKGRPSNIEAEIDGYKGLINTYHARSDHYCGGLNKTSVWLYADEMLRCFKDAGFTIIQAESPSNVNGETVLFVAKK